MFFDFPEIVIIFGVALVVLGPKKLPGTAAQIGRWVGRARAMARQFREQLEMEVNSVQSGLDVNSGRQPSIKGPASAPLEAQPDTAFVPGAEPTAEEPSIFDAPGMDWHPGYAEPEAEAGLAPYGDPNAIPQHSEPDAAEPQLSLQLGPPHAPAPAGPRAATVELHTSAAPASAEQRDGR